MYSIRILRRALKDIAKLPKDYARLVVEHIDRLSTTPRPPGRKETPRSDRLQFTSGRLSDSLRYR